jgi:hypothetical protein
MSRICSTLVVRDRSERPKPISNPHGLLVYPRSIDLAGRQCFYQLFLEAQFQERGSFASPGSKKFKMCELQLFLGRLAFILKRIALFLTPYTTRLQPSALTSDTS